MPGHLRNILIAAALALLALIAGIKGYVHHQIKTTIDNAITAARPVAQIKYSGISSSLISGEVELENVRIHSALLPEAVRLGTVTIETPGFGYMLNASDNIQQGIMPAHLGINFGAITFSMQGETATMLDRLIQQLQPIYASGRTLCGGKALLGPSDYREMGYPTLVSKLHISYEFDQDKQTLQFVFKADTDKVGSLAARMTLANIAGMASREMMQNGMPQLRNISIRYRDHSYTPRFVKYCATLGNMSKQLFIDTEINQPDEYFYRLWGFAPGTGLRDAYKDFLLKPDSIELNITPDKTFNPMQLAMADPAEVIRQLNLELKINELPVEDLTIKLPPAGFMQQFEQQKQQQIDLNAIVSGAPIKPAKPLQPAEKPKPKPAYHKISLAMAPYHIDNYVRITTTNDSIRKGRLIKIDKAYLYVQRKVNNGKFTVSIRKDKIKTIEAFYAK